MLTFTLDPRYHEARSLMLLQCLNGRDVASLSVSEKETLDTHLSNQQWVRPAGNFLGVFNMAPKWLLAEAKTVKMWAAVQAMHKTIIFTNQEQAIKALQAADADYYIAANSTPVARGFGQGSGEHWELNRTKALWECSRDLQA